MFPDAYFLVEAASSVDNFLAKNPDGYCGIGGTGVVCPIGLGVSAGPAA